MTDPAKQEDLSPQDSSQQLNYIAGSEHSVVSWQNPNSRRYAVQDDEGHATGTEWEWRSRENRKGRHVLLVNQDQAPSHRDRSSRIFHGMVSMLTVIAWWDISWWIGILFSVGSTCSVAAGILQWLPIAFPEKFPYDSTVSAGIVSFIRGILFALGGLLMVVEAVNANQTDCFGWAMKEVLNDDNENVELESSDEEQGNNKLHQTNSGFQPDRRNCTHIHNRSRMTHLIIHTKQFKAEARSTATSPWKWWPTWRDMRKHYLREIGFNANLILCIGTLTFFVTNLLTLPGIYDNLPQGVLYGLYYPTFLIGGTCFLVASILYILEVQRDWWKPQPQTVGWWVGVTNLIGSIGWIWSASLGYGQSSWCEYQSMLALVWAPAIYLMGSLMLVYEAIEKWPVHVDSDN